MPSSYTLGSHFETFVRNQVDSGRYSSASEVVRDGLRLLEDREARRARIEEALDAGLADMKAGRVTDIDEVFDELEARYTRMIEARKGR